MAFSSRITTILAALAGAALLIAGAYFFATGFTGNPVFASTESALLKAIATQDKDGDGLPDWEEVLYGTNPSIVDTKGLGMTDGEAVAKGLIVPSATPITPTSSPSPSSAANYGLTSPAEGSLTASFAKNFFSLYISAKQAKQGPLSEDELQKIAEASVKQLGDVVGKSPDFKTAEDIKLTEGGTDAFRIFAIAAEAVFIAHQGEEEKSEIEYLKDAVEKDDKTAPAHMRALAKRYKDIAAGLSVLAVPKEVSADHLVVVNTMARIGAIAEDFVRVRTDPLVTMLALTQYPETVLTLGNAFRNIHFIYKAAGIELSKGQPGASFVNVVPNVAATQATKIP